MIVDEKLICVRNIACHQPYADADVRSLADAGTVQLGPG